MIRGPYKYDQLSIYITKFVTFFVLATMLWSKINWVDYTLKIISILDVLFYTLLAYGIGWMVTYFKRQLFHTAAKNPISTHKSLELMHTYYLNGSTEAKFVCDDTDHSGKLVFEIKGIRGDVHLTPDQVKTYLSKTKES